MIVDVQKSVKYSGFINQLKIFHKKTATGNTEIFR